MGQTPRELVTRALTFKHPARIPRDLWLLPWAVDRYPAEVENIQRLFPSDFCSAEYYYPPSNRIKGDPYKIGKCTDEWGCNFVNIQEGIIGEVRTPIIDEIHDLSMVKPPYEQLIFDRTAAYSEISRYCDSSDKFVFANICPRPWERYQFLRGTENALMDVLMPDYGFTKLLKKINDFYLKEWEFWVKSDVDGVKFMDDWGAQDRLLIDPEMWREYFKPIYKEYIDMAKAEGKFVFMHSDGYILDIMEDLVEIGVDALNSQLFCMNIPEIGRKFKGRITFWGEIDRQEVLISDDPEDGRKAVKTVVEHLYDPAGGVIAQFEFGIGTNPDTAMAVFDEWVKY